MVHTLTGQRAMLTHVVCPDPRPGPCEQLRTMVTRITVMQSPRRRHGRLLPRLLWYASELSTIIITQSNRTDCGCACIRRAD